MEIPLDIDGGAYCVAATTVIVVRWHVPAIINPTDYACAYSVPWPKTTTHYDPQCHGQQGARFCCQDLALGQPDLP